MRTRSRLALVSPEAEHDVIRKMWLGEVVDADEGSMPPLLDVHWSRERQASVLGVGHVSVVSDDSQDALHDASPTYELDTQIDTAPAERSWVMALEEIRQEWSDWLELAERDDA